MSAPATALSDADPADDLAGLERALLDRQLEALSRLADMGMAVAGALERRVTADEAAAEPAAVLHHAAMDFARVSRAVRLTFALQSRLIADFKGERRARPPEGGADENDDWDGGFEAIWLEPDEDPGSIRARQVKDAVRDRAEAEALDREDVERLVLRAGERLGRPEFRAELLALPFDDLVALICRELNLPPPPQATGAVEGASGVPAPVPDLHAASP